MAEVGDSDSEERAWGAREEEMMRLALEQAVLAERAGEVPVGCVFVRPGTREVIASGHNLTNATGNVRPLRCFATRLLSARC